MEYSTIINQIETLLVITEQIDYLMFYNTWKLIGLNSFKRMNRTLYIFIKTRMFFTSE